MSTEAERIAVLETQMQHAMGTIEELKEQNTTIITQQQTLLQELTKYRGIWGGVTMVVSAIIVCLGLLKDWVVDLLK